MSEGHVCNLNFRHALPEPLLYVGFVDYYGPLDMRNHSPHRHDHYQFLLVTEGRFLFLPESGREIRLGAGDVVIFKPGVLHNWHVESGMTCRTLMAFFRAIPDGVFGQFGQRLVADTAVGHWQFPIPMAEAEPMLAALRSECQQNLPMADAVVYGLTMTFMTFASRYLAPEAAAEPSGGFPPPLAAALEFIEDSYSRQLSVEDIARQAGVGPTRLNQLFQTHIGTSPMRYLSNHRIDRAKILLLYSPFLIAEIATQTGFRSPQYFDRSFRISAGVTPSEFRAGRFERVLKGETPVR